MSNTVSLHPYFEAKEGKLSELKSLCPGLVNLCATEEKCTYFALSFSDTTMFCREAYEGAEGVIAHLENAGGEIGKVLEVADLVKLEVHGPREELDALKDPLKDLNPAYFAIEFGT